MKEFHANIAAEDGEIDTFICHPEEDGPHPAVIFYMDAPAIREELRDMARRIAATGYYVALPNLYYRDGTEGNYGFEDPDALPPGIKNRMERIFQLMNTLTNQRIVSDTAGLIDYIRKDDNAKKGPMGCVGYCMSGKFVTTVAAAYPDDFAAIASFYGVGIITDEADSPHLKADQIKGELYLAFAEEDQFVPQSVVDALPDILTKAGCKFRVETYPGTDHGFAFPERPAYDKPSAERHWERIHALFDRNLKP